MENIELSIGKINDVDSLSLIREFEKASIEYTESTVEEYEYSNNKNHEPVSTVLIVLSLSKLALDLIKLWNDEAPKNSKTLSIVIRFPDKTTMTIEPGNAKVEDDTNSNISKYKDIIESLKDIFSQTMS